ncbi:putative mitochondrial protein [Phytophthora megakarya]|uniref:Putative mitochondrial protein n=1 Tax=Phytophthora megakarya TaxID=4795 RepID=A0A225WQL7_9STRA|nr:putative mitochondrial protein [Phytophthora megakarya]
MERVEDGCSMNVVPPMFHAGISNKFTKRHVGNFRDTTLTAASNAKQRAERKLERQADAIEKQQQKIDHEMKKITEITQNLHRQQLREAKRLRNRLNYAASKVQATYRYHLTYIHQLQRDAAVNIQAMSRGFLARRLRLRLALHREQDQQNTSSVIISKCLRRFSARNIRSREIKHRYWGACIIQSMIRMIIARSYVLEQRRKQKEIVLQHQAAIVIQCNARSFMTRLIYLDVLYLICRIQAAMRGYLVRRQLRWLRVSDVDTFSKLQAYIRGFLVRKRIQIDTDRRSHPDEVIQEDFVLRFDGKFEGGCGDVKAGFCSSRSFSLSLVDNEKNGIVSLARSSTGLGWQPVVEPTIKRSYWLPAGASFDKRLPVLPVPKRMKALERVSAENVDPFGDELGCFNQSWTPKKRPHQKPCPARLSPMVIPPTKREISDPLSATMVEENPSVVDTEERLRRQEELKQKLQLRRIQEKRQQEHKLRLKREIESEANEQKLMEREEKAMRLQLKILRRRSREGKIRQVTADQRREERERLRMAREERHTRLHMKLCARKRRQKRTISTATSDLESQPPSIASSRYEGHTHRNPSATKSLKTTPRSRKRGDASSDEDMSFLDIDFTMPASMRFRTRPGGNNTGSSQLKKPRGNGTCTHAPTKKNQSLRKIKLKEDDCEYGDEFDEIVDEAALSHLIC